MKLSLVKSMCRPWQVSIDPRCDMRGKWVGRTWRAKLGNKCLYAASGAELIEKVDSKFETSVFHRSY